ncbi:MAG: resolvase, partial [Pseudomonadota bacterium]
EEKIDLLESEKRRFADQIKQIQSEKRPTFEEQLEPALNFITNPWKLWVSGDITLRRLVLKLAFADRLHYDRQTGPRTAHFSMPFKALAGIQGGENVNGGRYWD